MNTTVVLCCTFYWLLISCWQQSSRNVLFFKGTEAYDLAKAVESEDLDLIETLAKANPKLMDIANPISGSNVLALSVDIEKYNSFKKLLELGANPRFIDPYTKHSVLIDACKYYGNWEIDNRYIQLLLQYGADPNYAIEEDFVDEKGHHHYATTALMEASRINLDMVKILIRGGADPYKKLGSRERTPFSIAIVGNKDRFIISNYYIDSLKVDVHKPMNIRGKDTIYIQDYIRKYMAYKEGTESDNKKIEFIKKLESMGVDFKNYKYKL